MLTPVEIEVLLHCYYDAEPFNGLRRSPAIIAAIEKWLRAGCIAPESEEIMRTTPKGETIVQALCSVEVPE